MDFDRLEFHYYSPVDNRLAALIFEPGAFSKEGALSTIRFFQVRYNWTNKPVPFGFTIRFACESEERAWELQKYFEGEGNPSFTYSDPEELTLNEQGSFVARTLQHSGGDSSGVLQVSPSGVKGVGIIPGS